MKKGDKIFINDVCVGTVESVHEVSRDHAISSRGDARLIMEYTLKMSMPLELPGYEWMTNEVRKQEGKAKFLHEQFGNPCSEVKLHDEDFAEPKMVDKDVPWMGLDAQLRAAEQDVKDAKDKRDLGLDEDGCPQTEPEFKPMPAPPSVDKMMDAMDALRYSAFGMPKPYDGGGATLTMEIIEDACRTALEAGGYAQPEFKPYDQIFINPARRAGKTAAMKRASEIEREVSKEVAHYPRKLDENEVRVIRENVTKAYDERQEKLKNSKPVEAKRVTMPTFPTGNLGMWPGNFLGMPNPCASVPTRTPCKCPKCESAFAQMFSENGEVTKISCDFCGHESDERD